MKKNGKNSGSSTNKTVKSRNLASKGELEKRKPMYKEMPTSKKKAEPLERKRGEKTNLSKEKNEQIP